MVIYSQTLPLSFSISRGDAVLPEISCGVLNLFDLQTTCSLPEEVVQNDGADYLIGIHFAIS